MTKGAKIGIIVVVVIGLAVGGYFLYKKLSSDGTDGQGTDGDGTDDANKGDLINAPSNNVVSNLPTTPFQNQYQGDFFRIWINREYPKYAKEIVLSVKGDKNNAYIRKAWQKYGTEFLKRHGNILELKGSIPTSFYEKGVNKNYDWTIILDNSQLGVGNIAFYSDGTWMNHGKSPLIAGKWWDGGKQAACNKDDCGSVANVKASNFMELAKKIANTYKIKKSSFDGEYDNFGL